MTTAKKLPDLLNQVAVLKLTSGEEMIVKIEEVSEESITVSNPVSVAPGPQGMGLVPSMFTADPDSLVVINTRAITMYSTPELNVKDKYISATTGIQLPNKSIIMG
jgi:hypothetical protein